MLRVLDEDAWTPILESLGQTLGSASAVSSTWSQAASAANYKVFRPLACVVGGPAPGDIPSDPSSQAQVAWNRRSAISEKTWRDLAHTALDLAATPSCWQQLDLVGEAPSHRHSVSVCGAPIEAGEQAALLFGGNVSRTVAGRWKTSDELLLAKLPPECGGSCEISCLGKANATGSSASWPVGRWGASLTSLSSARYLVGGWSRDGDATKTWALRFREACVEWSCIQTPALPPASAFHTATALEDGKRLALSGGLGEGGSQKGIWYFAEDTESWQHISAEGPSCAGHAAASIDQSLLLFGGVKRSGGLFLDDRFSNDTSIFDVRKNVWCRDNAIRGGPLSRRNPTYARLGRHFIVSGGFDDDSCNSLDDTWAFDSSLRVWREVSGTRAPALEGHKSIMSGFDMFSFGGHSGPGSYPSKSMCVHSLSLGVGEDSLKVRSSSTGVSAEDGSDESNGDDSVSESDDGRVAAVRLPDGQVVPLRLLQALIRRQMRGESADDDSEAEQPPTGGLPNREW